MSRYNSDPKNYKNTSYDNYLDEARIDWQKRKTAVIEELDKLGYKNPTIDELAIDFPALDKSADEVSQIIKLETELKALDEERQQLWIEDLAVESLNKKHAVIHQDQFYILTERYNPILGGIDFSLESKQSFRSTYENKLVRCYDRKIRSKADIWLKSPERKEYKGIIFDPKKQVDGYYNLWKGFVVESKQGDCSLFWNHVKENICAKNEDYYWYVRKWLAIIIQCPDLVHTALVLRGSQGTGKNSFVEPIGYLFGQHYILLSSLSELLSNFNYHLKHAILIHANEAIWGGDVREIGRLKAMITERNCLIEGKCKDRFMVPSFRHFIVSSNDSWPVHMDADDRRFFVLNVSDAHKEDHKYFEALENQLKNGGYEALLYDLLNEDITKFNPRFMPINQNAFDIKLRSSNSAHKYIYEALLECSFGNLTLDSGDIWQDLLIKDVFSNYSEWCKANGERMVSKEVFSKELLKLISSTKVVRPNEGGKRPRKYRFPCFEKARDEFCRSYKTGNEIWDDNEDEKI